MWPLDPSPFLFVALLLGAPGPVPPDLDAFPVLRPPAEVRFVPPAPAAGADPPGALRPPAPWLDAGWWRSDAAARSLDVFAGRARAEGDSLAWSLEILRCGRSADAAADARPDAALARRLRLWRLAAAWLPGDVKPWLLAQARAEAYRRIRAREAELFDEFLAAEIPVTTP